MNKLAVVALGGNAILRDKDEGTIEEQERNVAETLENILYLIRDGYQIVLTHGNGPQVGNILMRNDAGEQLYSIAQMPLDICVADSQGGIGYMIERQFRNVLIQNNIKKDIVTLVTQVLVKKDDEAFQHPRKRIGKVYNKTKANILSQEKGWIFKESPKVNGGWQRVVPSPKPIDVFNKTTIAKIAHSGTIVIASGGGGIPVYYDHDGLIRTTDAVVDKDLASALLASKLMAHELYILTDVPYVYIDFNTPKQRKIEFLNRSDTLKYLDENKFGEGSMAPKIRAALQFVENGGEKSVITEATKLEDRSFGTKITLEYER